MMPVIFYAVCVEGNNWNPTGWKTIEPMKVFGKEPVGKDPQWCCEDFATAYHWRNHMVIPGHPWEEPCLRIKGYRSELSAIDMRDEDPAQRTRNVEGMVISHCPFCGEKIVFEHHLDVRVKETEQVSEPSTHKTNSYEIAAEVLT